MSAFRLVEGIALKTFVTIANSLYYCKRIFVKALEYHFGSGDIFKACHDFAEIGEGYLLATAGPAAHKKTRLVADAV